MTQTADAPVAELGLVARMTGMFFGPSATFPAVVAHPRPAGVLFLVCLLTGLATGLPQFSESGRQGVLEMQVQSAERFRGEPVTPEAYAQMERFSRYSGYLAIGSTFLTLPVFCMLAAGLWWAILNVTLGGTATFKQVLTVVTHSQVVTAAGALIGAPIQMATGTFSLAGPFSLAGVIPVLEPGTFGSNFLASISVFTVWQLVVQGIGLAVLYRRSRAPLVTAVVLGSLALTAAIVAVTS